MFSAVAVYFKYHTLDAIRADVQRLNCAVSFHEDLAPLFRPVRIDPFRVGNSLCIQPMEGCDGTLDGAPDELTFRRYRRFGAGGAKLIWGEAAAVTEEGRATPRQLLFNDANVPGFARLLHECQQAHRETFGSADDLLVGIQLTHSGRYSFRKPIIATHCPMLDPRTRVTPETAILSDDEIFHLIDAYVLAAKRAYQVGFHFVDIKQCHRYLLSEFLGAHNRPGPFGGSLENRTRLARTIFERIRSEIPGLLLATRINLYDGIPYHKGPSAESAGEPDAWTVPLDTTWGTSPNDPFTPDLSEPLKWIGQMKQLGVALVNTSLGNPYGSPHLLRPFEYPPPDGYLTPEHPLLGVARHFRLTAEIQRTYPELPIVGSGYSWLQEFLPQAGAANIAQGAVTFVGVGRASLSMPDFAKLLLETGKLDRRRICRTFSYCTALMRSKHNELGQFATGCPPFDKEVYGPLWELAKK
jgi:2,4-dienoyl-CoA reductase-like NADH-dependent reductase (Old Yellow Enzyme family)